MYIYIHINNNSNHDEIKSRLKSGMLPIIQRRIYLTISYPKILRLKYAEI